MVVVGDGDGSNSGTTHGSTTGSGATSKGIAIGILLVGMLPVGVPFVVIVGWHLMAGSPLGDRKTWRCNPSSSTTPNYLPFNGNTPW